MTDEQPTPPPTPAADAPAVVVEERLHPLSPIAHLWIGVVAFGWFAVNTVISGDPIWADVSEFGQRLGSLPSWVLWLGGALVLGLGWGYWSWWTTRFVIDDTEFRLENRGAFQQSQRIAFSRIQSVDVTQPFAARLLGLAQVKIDVGADGGATLSFLKRSRATEIRDYLMSRAHGRATSTTEPGRTASAWDDSASGDTVLIRLTPGEIILSAVASAEILWILAGFGLPWVLSRAFGWQVFDGPGAGVFGIAYGGGAVGLAIVLLGYLSKRLFGQFNYTLARTPAGLRITRGLFTLRSQTIPVHRVQAVQTRQSLIWRWLGRARLDLTVLGLGALTDGEEMTTSTIYLPFGTARQVQVALAAIWPGLELEKLTFTRTPRRARWLDPFEWSWQGYALDDRVLAMRSGWTYRQQLIVPHARLQAMRVSQGPLERRLDLASVQVHTTSLLGVSTIDHLDAPVARRLAFTELDRARVSRVEELLDPPGLRAASAVPVESGVGLVRVPDAAGPPSLPWEPAGASASEPDIWTPPTAPLPDVLPTAPAPPAPVPRPPEAPIG